MESGGKEEVGMIKIRALEEMPSGLRAQTSEDGAQAAGVSVFEVGMVELAPNELGEDASWLRLLSGGCYYWDEDAFLGVAQNNR